jgi:putative ABC transport system permease protein
MLLENLRIALRSLGTNKLRASLTMLGITIGVAAVITLLSVGQGVSRYVAGQFEGLGTNLVFVFPGQFRPRRGSARPRRRRCRADPGRL